MTNERDLDRTTRAWLDLMPDEVPDRVIADVLNAVESAPQVRGPRIAGPMRSIQMNRYTLIAAVAVIGVGLLGGVILAGGRDDSTPSMPPSPQPAVAVASASPSASADAAKTGVPGDLQATWFGSHRDLPGIEVGSGTVLRFGPTGIAVAAPNLQARGLLSAKTTFDGTRLRAVSAAGTDPCSTDQVGIYEWSLSGGGKTLTLSLASDPCIARATTLPGTWWRAACKIGTTCLGDLEAGTFASQYFNLRANAAGAWAPMFGSLTYTVPHGWANSEDWPSWFALTPSSSYASEDATGSPPDGVSHEIRVLARPAAAVQDGTCNASADPLVTTSADGLMNWLTSRPGISAENVGLASIDGHRAVGADIRFASDYKAACPGESRPSMALFAPRGSPADDRYLVDLFAGERLHVILVQVIGGDVAAIVIDDRNDVAGPDPARFQELVDAAMPIVDSMHFQ